MVDISLEIGVSTNIKVKSVDDMRCLEVGDALPERNDVVLARFCSESEAVGVLGDLRQWLAADQRKGKLA